MCEVEFPEISRESGNYSACPDEELAEAARKTRYRRFLAVSASSSSGQVE